MPQFLTTAGLNFHIEQLLKDARQEILIISPYVSLLKKTRSLLKVKKQEGVRIEFACRLADLKESLEGCATQVHDVPTLHAKCYLTEAGAVLTSLNLHRFSQQNNDEMGMWIPNAGQDAKLYAQVLEEARRLCPESEPLEVGRTYSMAEINAHFEFEPEAIKKGAGIRKAASGEVVVFNNSEEKNPTVDGIVYYCGQETGGPVQEFKFGNALLRDCWNDQRRIHMFENGNYAGLFRITEAPYPDTSGKLRFPLAKAAAA